jgi:hypothetical protein
LLAIGQTFGGEKPLRIMFFLKIIIIIIFYFLII